MLSLNNIRVESIEFVIFCTQSPDYFLPTSACLIQDRLGISTVAGALDINLGCSGYIYGLSLAKGLVETGQVDNVLLITAETYSKYIRENDMSVRAIFGDAAAATFVKKNTCSSQGSIGPFIFGTDGSGADNLIVKNGASRESFDSKDGVFLAMNGPQIFSFTLEKVNDAIDTLLKKTNLSEELVDYFIFHQANKFMLDHLRKRCKISEGKFIIDLEEFGNTVSSTIPIALSRAINNKRIEKGDLIMLVGFGVGYSWGATLVRV